MTAKNQPPKPPAKSTEEVKPAVKPAPENKQLTPELETKTQKPTIGRVVHFVPKWSSYQHEFPGIQPAIVTDAADMDVNLRVQWNGPAPAKGYISDFVAGVPYHDPAPGEAFQEGTWHWMPYQKQKFATEQNEK